VSQGLDYQSRGTLLREPARPRKQGVCLHVFSEKKCGRSALHGFEIQSVSWTALDTSFPMQGEWVESMRGARGSHHRRETNHSPMHAATCSNPSWFQLVTGHNEELTAGLLEMVEKMLPKPEDQVEAMQQLQVYLSRLGCSVPRWRSTRCLPCRRTQSTYGGGTPELQRVAVRVLAQVSTAGSCERNRSS
jgi:hypothetical protein